MPYLNPLSFSEDSPNPFVFMLFRQNVKDMTLTDEWRQFLSEPYGRFFAREFANAQNLIGKMSC